MNKTSQESGGGYSDDGNGDDDDDDYADDDDDEEEEDAEDAAALEEARELNRQLRDAVAGHPQPQQPWETVAVRERAKLEAVQRRRQQQREEQRTAADARYYEDDGRGSHVEARVEEAWQADAAHGGGGGLGGPGGPGRSSSLMVAPPRPMRNGPKKWERQHFTFGNREIKRIEQDNKLLLDRLHDVKSPFAAHQKSDHAERFLKIHNRQLAEARERVQKEIDRENALHCRRLERTSACVPRNPTLSQLKARAKKVESMGRHYQERLRGGNPGGGGGGAQGGGQVASAADRAAFGNMLVRLSQELIERKGAALERTLASDVDPDQIGPTMKAAGRQAAGRQAAGRAGKPPGGTHTRKALKPPPQLDRHDRRR